MKRVIVIALWLLLPGAAIAQQAPFCVVSGAGQQCHYYVMQSCQSAARTFQGMCVANQQPATLPASPPPQPRQPYQSPGQLYMPDIGGSFADGVERGRRAKQEREEHEARMELLRAQTEAVKASTAATPIDSPTMPPTNKTFGELAEKCQRLADGVNGIAISDDFSADAAAMYCWGYVDGFVHRQTLASEEWRSCPGGRINPLELIEKMPAAIQAAPSLGEKPPATGLALLLKAIAPCP